MLKTDILTKLSEADDYVSGQELCELYGVSRTAVWKAVNSLKKEGFEIDSVTNKGYRLKQSDGDILSGSSIMSALKTDWLGKSCLYFDTVDSTNDELRRRYSENADIEDGTVAITSDQTAGKGRRGRAWEAPRDCNIAMSFLLKPEFEPDKASMLTLLAALAVAEGTQIETECECQIKWPNDVIIGKKKYCGILTEMSSEIDFIHYVIVGIGVNVNTPSFPEELQDKATSLLLETGKTVSRTQIAVNILKSFEKYYESFCEAGDLSPVLEEYNAKLVSRDSEVRVLDPKGEYSGISRGINSQGELIVELPDKSVKNVYAGEVSVRGIYGYV